MVAVVVGMGVWTLRAVSEGCRPCGAEGSSQHGGFFPGSRLPTREGGRRAGKETMLVCVWM